MALAFIYPEGEKGGRGKLSTKQGEFSKYMQNRVSQARSILRHSRKLAEAVLKGVISRSTFWNRKNNPISGT